MAVCPRFDQEAPWGPLSNPIGTDELSPSAARGRRAPLRSTISAQPITSFAHLFPPPLGFPAQAATVPGWPGKAPRAVAPRKNQLGTAPARRFSARGIAPSRDPIPTRLFTLIEPPGFLHSPPVHDARAAEGTEAGWRRRENSIRLIRGRFWVDRVARTY